MESIEDAEQTYKESGNHEIQLRRWRNGYKQVDLDCRNHGDCLLLLSCIESQRFGWADCDELFGQSKIHAVCGMAASICAAYGFGANKQGNVSIYRRLNSGHGELQQSNGCDMLCVSQIAVLMLLAQDVQRFHND